ncbi:MAG TPA: non-homologous end-joining DNA ligase, partial [Terrimicrobiaceae bacterium]
MAKREHIQIDGRELVISNLGKVFFPENGFTKGQVIAFYSAISETILPHLRDRPLTLKRYPDGIGGEHFYEKNAPSHTPSWVKRFAVPRSEGGPDIHYVLCNDHPTLIWVTNLGDVEKHVLLARAPEINRPTSLVFDLDPGEPADILDCGRVALHLRSLFESLGLQCFVKVSGSKGLHLAVPLNVNVDYEATQPFAKALADLAARQLPDSVVSEMSKSIRRGKVLIDWSQNSDFKTTVCVYAMRAKPNGPFISMPVTWEELARAVKRNQKKDLFFEPEAAVKRIAKLGDLFEPVLSLKQKLPQAFVDAVEAGPPPRLVSWQRKSGKVRDKSLHEYAAKRDLTRTPEPAAEAAGGKKAGVARRFVVQKHQASHLHYDWRLEMEGVLRSWAIPKGPPTKLREARLAMQVEDHPLAYGDFEGTIPPGNYGAGTVMLWDKGEYEEKSNNPSKAYHSGKMHLVLRGEKLKGEWVLTKDKEERESNKWLLIKAGEDLPSFSAKRDDTSVLSGRSMRQIGEANDAQWESNRPSVSTRVNIRRIRRKHEEPDFVEPMQCKSVAELPAGENWTFEIKFDGYRCIAVKRASEVTLFSRNKKILDARFPEIRDALAQLEGDFAVDGELVAFDPAGRPSFRLLQNAKSNAPPVYYFLFDLLNLNGEPLLRLPLAQRREALTVLMSSVQDPLRLSAQLQAPSGQVIEAVRRVGLEGVVGKRSTSIYEPGERSGEWVKIRTNNQQEFVIGGYVPGSRGFDALLIGVYDGEHLRFVGKVRNGFLTRTRREILPALEKRKTSQCPFSNLPEKRASRWGEPLTAEKMKQCRWIKPELICEVEFLEWTEAGHLRHCTFVAM